MQRINSVDQCLSNINVHTNHLGLVKNTHPGPAQLVRGRTSDSAPINSQMMLMPLAIDITWQARMQLIWADHQRWWVRFGNAEFELLKWCSNKCFNEAAVNTGLRLGERGVGYRFLYGTSYQMLVNLRMGKKKQSYWRSTPLIWEEEMREIEKE